MNKIRALIVSLSALPIVAFAVPALADSPGQLGGGAEVYQVKNLTQGGSYANTISANACDELQYSIELHNTSFGGFSSVDVGVNLPGASSTTNTSTVTATTNLGGTTGTTGTATVNLSSAQTISYENGTTVLYDENGNVIKTLSDTITSGGVNIGALNGSTTEFVNFKAKVVCPTPAPTPKPSPTPTAAAAPSKLPSTGPGDVAELFVGTSTLAGVSHYLFRRFRN